MATERQLRANKLNAQKSTGPTSSTGKVASAANARKHGLTTLPERASVVSWYRLILNDVLALPNPMERNERLKAAYSLAVAEAKLQRVIISEEEHLGELDPSVESAKISREIEHEIELVDEALFDPVFLRKRRKDKKLLRILEKLEHSLVQHKVGSARRWSKQAGRLARYRSEAEAQRRRALRNWTDVGFTL